MFSIIYNILKLIEKNTRISNPFNFIGLALLSLLFSKLSDGHIIAIILVVLIALLWWLANVFLKRKTQYITDDQKPEPVKGLILLISPYSCDKSEIEPLLKKIYQASPQELQKEDFDAIKLFDSNLLPPIKAVEYHSAENTLKEIWLITTLTYQMKHPETGELIDIKGSENASLILEKYLNFKYGDKLEIHRQEFKGKSLTVKDREYGTLSELIDHIFRKSGYQPSSMIADITGGTKRMSVALAIACLPLERKMQYMDSQRDWQGKPLSQGNIQPVEIDINPIVYRNKQHE